MGGQCPRKPGPQPESFVWPQVRQNEYIEDYTWVMMLDYVSRRERLQYSAHLVDMTTGKEVSRELRRSEQHV